MTSTSSRPSHSSTAQVRRHRPSLGTAPGYIAMQSSAVRAFKALSSKINPQLPLNPRESQQLLQLLSSSFRQHLDREHPHDHPSNLETQAPHRSRSAADALHRTHLTPSQASVRNVVNSILSNPLFSRPGQKFLTSTKVFSDTDSNEKELQKVLSQPVEWFEEQIAQGTVSKDLACTYLTLVLSMSDAIVQAEYGRRAVAAFYNWLWASGSADSLDFIQSDKFTKNVVYLLVKHGHEEKIWTWIDHLNALKRPAAPRDLEDKQVLLLMFTANARRALSNDADAPLSVLFDMMDRTKGLGAQAVTKTRPLVLLNSNLRKQILHGLIKPKNEVVFGKFLQASLNLAKNSHLCYSQLMLVHPRAPDAAPAVSYIRHRLQSGISPSKFIERPGGAKFVLDTAQVLISQENYHDATWVMSLAHDYFSEEHRPDSEPVQGDSTKSPSSTSKAELASLEVLAGWSPG